MINQPVTPLPLPDDIPPKWLNVIRRMIQAATSGNENWITILSIHIVVDKNGCPRFWTEPTVKRIEPTSKSKEFLEIITKTFADD